MSAFEARHLHRVVGDRLRIEDVSLSLASGERLAVVGPSGCGKSSLLRLLAGLDPLDGGELTLDGKTPEAWGLPRWRHRVAWVPQAFARPPGTPQETWDEAQSLRVARDQAVDDPRAIAARWSLSHAAWDAPWAELSGGEAQRAWLAIAWARRPEVLLLDEPTSALDPEATAAFEADLLRCRAVVVTHDAAQAARVASRLLRLGAP